MHSTQDYLKNLIKVGSMTLLTFGQTNFLFSSDENSGILIKIVKQIFDYNEQNKDIKIDLKVRFSHKFKLTCMDDQLNDLLESKKVNLEKFSFKMNKNENLMGISIQSLDKFKNILKQSEIYHKRIHRSSNKSFYIKLSFDIYKNNNHKKKTTCQINIFDISDILIHNLSNSKEQSKSILKIYKILCNINEEKSNISNKESKFERMLYMILNKTFFVKGSIYLYLFISQRLESLDSLEIIRKINKLKLSSSFNQEEKKNFNHNENKNPFNSKVTQASFCEIPLSVNSSIHDSLRDNQEEAEVINNLENEVSYLKKMILKKEGDEFFNLTQPKNFILESGSLFRNDINLRNNNNLSQNNNFLRSNCKNVINNSFNESKYNPFVNIMSNSKSSNYGNNSDNDYDLHLINNEMCFLKNNHKLSQENLIIKENNYLKEELSEIKKNFSEIVKEKDNRIKNLNIILKNNESNLNEIQINYNEINLQYKELFEENKRKEDEMKYLKENNLERELKNKIRENIQNNESTNHLYYKEIDKNNNLFNENQKLFSELQKSKSIIEKFQN